MVVLVLSCTENFEAAAEEKTLDYEYEFYEKKCLKPILRNIDEEDAKNNEELLGDLM